MEVETGVVECGSGRGVKLQEVRSSQTWLFPFRHETQK